MPIYPDLSGGSLAGFPDYEVFATPGGTDNAEGSANAPKEHLYAAIQAVIAAGGGTVNYTANTTVGGPVPEQGIWLREDGINVPGFLDMAGCPIRFNGIGNQSGTAFQRPGGARFEGGSTNNGTGDYTKPGIWVIGTERSVAFINCLNSAAEGSTDGIISPVRLGWDYVRKTDFSINWLDITTGNRGTTSSGPGASLSRFTVDLDTAQSWTVTTARRTSNTTTLTLTRPLTLAMAPWVIGSIIRVTTGSDPDFDGGDYVVTGQTDVLNLTSSDVTIEVSYAEIKADHASKAIIGTVVSHGCAVGDYISTQMTDSEFVTCSQMRVTAVTVDTITVFDPYGYSPRSANTGNVSGPGTLVKQLRGRQVASNVQFTNCTFFGKAGSLDIFTASPTMDFGGTSASNTRINGLYTTGGNAFDWTAHTDRYDPSRTQCAIFADPGAGTLSGASLQAYDCQSQAGHVVWNPQQTEATIYIDQWLQDSAGNALPTVVLGAGNTGASFYLDRIANADASQADIQIGAGYDRLRGTIGDVYSSCPTPIISESSFVGPSNIRTGVWNTSAVTSPWVAPQQCTIWSGGLSTEHKGINWTMGGVTARYANLFPAVADWGVDIALPAGITVTFDGTGADRGGTAFKVVNGNGANTAVTVGPYPFAWTDGDGAVFSAWVKFPAVGGSIVLSSYNGTDTLFNGSNQLRIDPYSGTTAWQPISHAARIVGSGAHSGKFYISLNAPVGTSYLWLPTLLRIPVADAMADAELFEWGSNAKPQPLYLPAGMTGLPEDGKLIAPGGVGIGGITKVVGVGSGQLTLTGTGTVYEPRYADDGVTVKGWVALLQATVNP